MNMVAIGSIVAGIGVILLPLGALISTEDNDLDLEYSQREHGVSKSKAKYRFGIAIFALALGLMAIGFLLLIGAVIHDIYPFLAGELLRLFLYQIPKSWS